MTAPIPFTMSNESITVVHKGKSTVVRKGAPQFIALRKAVMEENWDAVVQNLTVKKSVSSWAKGKFTFKGDNKFLFEGKEIPSGINERIIEMATRNEDPTPVFRFWERLQKNPSYRSVNQLWGFLKHKGIPLTKDGCFYAYKSVKANMKDHHSGKFDNSPGQELEMPRNQISDDSSVECHEGFHVGALEYAKSFGSNDRHIVICKVDPENVVSVPNDSNGQKMRVCKYKVVGHHNGEMMPDTTIEEDTSYGDSELEAVNAPTPEEAKNFFLNEAHETHTTKSAVRKERAEAKGSSFDMLKAMNTKELMEESLDTLRQYAGKGLNIVGASKVPGGKVALVSTIMKHRKN